MSLRSEWDAISARIDGLLRAAELIVSTAAAVGSDYFGAIDRVIIPNAGNTFDSLVELYSRYHLSMPSKARRALEEFVTKQRQFFSNRKVNGFPALQGTMALLQSIRTELSHHLADTQYESHRLVERAFAHLSRSILVDSEVRSKWRAAFDRHETHCERLGSIHLLSHGLWAFKASALGGATDLLLGSALETEKVSTAANALVLTEWKRVRNRDEAEVAFQQARAQAENYSTGVLGGVELRDYRYLVIVSAKSVELPADVTTAGGVTYRHVNVAVAPDRPSAWRSSGPRAPT